MQVVDKTQFFNLNNDEYLIKSLVEQDVDDIIRDNHKEAETSDGFSDGRTMRKIMSLSHVDYLNALKHGYNLDTSDPMLLRSEVHRYLTERGRDAGMQTVKHILTPGRDAGIIIK